MLKRVRITPEDYRKYLFIGEKGVKIDSSKSHEELIRKDIEQGTKEMHKLLPKTSGNKGQKPRRGRKIGGR